MRAVENALLVCFAVFAFAYGMTHATNVNDFIGGCIIGLGMTIAIAKFFEDW